MSLGTKIVQSIQKEAAMNRPLPLTATAQEGAATASVKLADNDRFSHLVDEVKVKNPQSKAQTPQRAAEKFATRTTYLTEALQFVECERDGAAIVRSTPETMSGRRAEYYEARVTPDEISLQRYQPNREKPGRETVPFCATDEVLGRLVDDAAGVLLMRASRSLPNEQPKK